MKPVRVGCSGWNYSSWRGLFYPRGVPASRWLECYAQHLDTVEVNATFYRLTTVKAVERWVAQTSEAFCFAVKASRYLTHVKRLHDIAQGLERFCAPLAPMSRAGRLGAVLWQLPETFHRDDETLAGLLEQLPEARHAIEFRHPSWFAEEVFAMLAAHDVALVQGDHPGRPFQTHEATASWRYLRFHYGARGRRGNYSESELEEWAQRIHRWRATHELLVYFNNDWEGFAPRNAQRLQRRLEQLAGQRPA
ncbi:MAG TPA: DUF72 domain-containing protein [Solirubrobacteraceae bacterium]|nr:DUF72 domain-containing protein [Solirubrobacteraceae bacterium]